MNCLNCCVTDLALGDCHLIPIDDVTSRKEGNDWVSIQNVTFIMTLTPINNTYF